jgi:MoxR-like ATPase
LVAKDEIIEVLGIALIASENAFLLGPPGTGKSAIVHELASRLQGKAFDYLLTRFTEPSELFGPFDLRKLRDGDLITNTDGMLPEADFVFLDELLNANSAILNSLLMALNERVFRRGREKVSLPMLMAVSASNHLPNDDALAALFDRFLLRVHCDNVPQDRMSEVLVAGWSREQALPIAGVMPLDEARLLQAAVQQVDLEPIRLAYLQLIQRLRNAGMSISDRRAVRLQRVIAASAVMCGRNTAIVNDLWVARYIWDSLAQVEMLVAHVNTIVKEFTVDDANAKVYLQNVHPLAEQSDGPDPERLAHTLDAIRSNPRAPGASDSLALLASRVEWIVNEVSREDLRNRVRKLQEELVSEGQRP